MLATLDRWTRQLTPDGVAFACGADPRSDCLRVRERLTPLRPLRRILDELLAGSASWFSEPAPGQLERLITAEGESAGLVTIAGRVGGEPAERTIGLIVGDDAYTQIDALVRDPARFADFRIQARELTAGLALGLGALRWRRYGYRAPEGWQGLSRGLGAEWYPLEFPAHRALIAVQPARPAAQLVDPSAVQIERLLREHTLAEAGFCLETSAAEPIATPTGLLGMYYRVTGEVQGEGGLACDTAVLGDGRFAYVLRLECGLDRLDDDRARFAELVRSVEPVPAVPAVPGDAAAAMDHWVC